MLEPWYDTIQFILIAILSALQLHDHYKDRRRIHQAARSVAGVLEAYEAEASTNAT